MRLSFHWSFHLEHSPFHCATCLHSVCLQSLSSVFLMFDICFYLFTKHAMFVGLVHRERPLFDFKDISLCIDSLRYIYIYIHVCLFLSDWLLYMLWAQLRRGSLRVRPHYYHYYHYLLDINWLSYKLWSFNLIGWEIYKIFKFCLTLPWAWNMVKVSESGLNSKAQWVCTIMQSVTFVTFIGSEKITTLKVFATLDDHPNGRPISQTLIITYMLTFFMSVWVSLNTLTFFMSVKN